MHSYDSCELLYSRKRLEYHCTGPIQILRTVELDEVLYVLDCFAVKSEYSTT